ncbi:MAG: metallophosphoesterase [Bacteroidaceae bacterium]|nr:metallophosphoesterase [Bacteroidaceae bacterium]
MKKLHILYTLILACALQFATAQNYVVTSVAKQGATYLTVAEKSLQFDLAGGEQTVAVSSNIDFKVESDADWCTVTKESASVKISVKASEANEDRTALITIKGKDGHVQIIEVTQYAPPTFAVISDVHFGNTMGEGPMVKVPRALKNISSHKKLDAIFVVGDLTNTGDANQYKQLVQVFSDKGNFTNPVDRTIFMMGNHDNYAANSTYKNGLKAFNDGKQYPLDQYIVIKGYPFICISNRNGSNNDDASLSNGEGAYPKEVRDTLENWLARAAKECPGKPIFVFTHVPPKNTCYCTWPGEGDGDTWPTWGMRVLNPILNKYPQAVVFCGHSHFPLGDPRSIHQGVNPNSDKQNYFTVINTASTTYSEIHGPSVDAGIHPNGYEHITEGLLVDVQPAGDVEVRRYDTKLNEEIQPDNRWLLKAPFDGSQFAYADIRDTYDNIYGKKLRDGLPAPEFASEAAVKVVTTGSGVSVTFPQASDNDVVFRYKVQIINSKGYAVKNRWIFSEFYKNSEMPDSLTVTFGGLEIGAEYTAAVVAYDSYENASEKIVSSTFTPNVGDVIIPQRIGLWKFDSPNDIISNSEGPIQITPGVVASNGYITMNEKLSESNMQYVDGPTATNGALHLSKGSMFKLEPSGKLSSYTIMYDVRVSSFSNYHALLQTSVNNNNDADIFINKSGNVGLNYKTMGYGGQCATDTWHRIVVSVSNGSPAIYVDGEKVTQATFSDVRWEIQSAGTYLFCDEDGEVDDIDVAEIALWDEALNDAQVVTLGFITNEEKMTVSQTEVNILDEKEFKLTVTSTVEPSFACPEWVHLLRPVPSMGSFTYVFAVDAMPEDVLKRTGELVISAPEGSGIAPITIPLVQKNSNGEIPAAKGVWTFENAENVLANSGDANFTMQAGRMNGKEVTMVDILGSKIEQTAGPASDNKAILLPKDILLNVQFAAASDEKIKNYTIMYDLREEKNNDFNALLQPDLDNATDAMVFINEKAQIGVYANGNWGYGGHVYAGRWHRIILTVKNGIPNAYLDGELVTPGKNDYNGAWCLDPKGCHLFGDENGERMNFEVAEIRYWDEPLSTMQVAALGEIDYKYIYSETKSIELLENKNEFTIDLNSSVIPEFVLPEWIKLVEGTPATGSTTYKFKADDLETAGTREGTISIKEKDGDDVVFVTINVKQEFSGGTLPKCTGKWLFDNATDLYTSSEGSAKLVPYKFGANNSAPTAYDSPADATVEVIEEGITLRKASCFKMELNEPENLGNYTVVFDVRVPSHTWRGLLQTNLKNDGDAGIFIKSTGEVGLGVSGFGYAGSVPTNEWCKIAIVVKAGYPSVYINGKLVNTSTSTNSDRWVMNKSSAYLFCDNDGEVADIDIAGIYFWNKAFTNEQIATMGTIE